MTKYDTNILKIRFFTSDRYNECTEENRWLKTNMKHLQNIKRCNMICWYKENSFDISVEIMYHIIHKTQKSQISFLYK